MAGERVGDFETVRQHKNGALLDVSVTVSPIRGDHGQIIGASKIVRDMTAHKQVEEQLRTRPASWRMSLTRSLPLMCFLSSPSGTRRPKGSMVGVPIVFFSSESDRTTQLAALSEGGDDFLTKTIHPDHLITTLRSRMDRARSLRAHLVRDGLTGLLNHAAIMAQLDVMLARTRREQGNCAVALVDLDHFKHVNDTYGHIMGDQVLRSFAHLLAQTVRKNDGIGRVAGEEFVIIFPATTSIGAANAVETLRKRWSRVQHQAAETTFTVTMSAGIAQHAQDEAAPTLLGMADQALSAAKQAGRNRLVLASDHNHKTYITTYQWHV